MNKNEKKFLKLEIENARLKGDFIGTLKGILFWPIPDDLKLKIQSKIKELEK